MDLSETVFAPGLVLGGVSSSSGKTICSCLLLAALKQRGIPVSAFKVGPDYIDAGYHSKVLGKSSRNLDTWLMGEDQVHQEFTDHTRSAFPVVEGVMGLFDGADVNSNQGSTYEIAETFNLPIVLVISCEKFGRSIGAVIEGFKQESGGRVQGVILNRVGSESHGEYLSQALASKTSVLGVVPVIAALAFNERHLGLQASQELEAFNPVQLAELAEQMLDIDQLMAIGQLSPSKGESVIPQLDAGKKAAPPHCRVAIASDEAFHFYYPSNLHYLEQQGVELVEFSPLHTEALPDDIDGVILGGGFPEEYAAALSANQALRNSIQARLQAGLPCYAECGGLMYLTQSVCLPDRDPLPMVGVIPGKIKMSNRLQHFGYSTCQREGASHPLIRGHEFHYSRWDGEAQHANLWQVTKYRSGKSRMEGYHTQNVWASYVHVYWSSCPECIEPFLKKVISNREQPTE